MQWFYLHLLTALTRKKTSINEKKIDGSTVITTDEWKQIYRVKKEGEPLYPGARPKRENWNMCPECEPPPKNPQTF